jgi:hypothetical protein
MLVSLASWYVFYPGVMSFDSLYMYYEVQTGLYSDFHPIFLPLILSLILKAGGGLGLVTLVQIVLGSFGIRRFTIALTRFFGIAKEGVIDRIACLIIALLFSPLTPASIYFATLWSDTWLVISLLWCIAFLVEMYQSAYPLNTGGMNIKLAGYLVLSSIALLVRYNALAVYPALAFSLYWVLRQKPFPRLFAVIALPLPVVMLVGFTQYQYKIEKILPSHPQNVAVVLDLASMIEYDPGICTDLYLRSCDIVLREFPPEFIVGDGAIDFTLNQGKDEVYAPFLHLFFYPRLISEYAEAVHDHPDLLVRVKLLNYLDYLRPDPTRYFFQDHDPGDVSPTGLSFPLDRPEHAQAWFSVTHKTIQNPVLRWFSYVHAPWLVINLLGLMICAFLAARIKKAVFLFLILLIPASYYMSYLITLTASEFRLMYPSTLIVQVIILSFMIANLPNLFKRLLFVGKTRSVYK